MIHIGEYKESIRDDSLPSIWDLIQDEPIPEKEKILAYMKKWDTGDRAIKYLKDEKTGRLINVPFCGYCDGKYVWCSDAVYHFEKYNMKLEDEFIEHILSQE